MSADQEQPKVFVTQPYLPPLEEFIPYLREIWDSRILTNCGAMHHKLEDALCKYLGVEHIALFNNGTIALLAALKALCVTGEVITTAYSFVATSHSLLWNDLEPVFVDIDPQTFNIDASKIEAAITPRTSAILPVHCYGAPCDAAAIQKVADAHGLRVIYDAAHAFGVQDAGGSVLRHGDLSVLSFHATKVFNTFEGGAIVCPNAEIKKHIDSLKNFGFSNEITVVDSGINGKLSEVNAAFGLLQLEYVDEAIQRRKIIDQLYRHRLSGVRAIVCPKPLGVSVRNYSYFPILVEADYPISRDALYEELKTIGVHARRYFYPLISDFSMYRDFPSAKPSGLPVAKRVAEQVICLPIYPDLALSDVEKIATLIEGLA